MTERSQDAGLSPADQAAIRDLLSADRQDTMARVASLTRDWDDIVESSSFVATDDEHDPEGSSTAFERAHVQALLDQTLDHLADLDRAVERLGDGTYGICEACGHAIAIERLQVRPAAKTCVSCATGRR